MYNRGLKHYSCYKYLIVFMLFRALEFFCAFTSLLVSEYRDGSLADSLLNAVYLAYDQSLSRHHNWFMRGTFYVSFSFRYSVFGIVYMLWCIN